MTEKEIVRTISDEIGLTGLQKKEIVQKTFNAIVEALVDEGRIELRNFGVFEVKRRAPPRPVTRERAIRSSSPRSTSSPSSRAKRWKSAVRELERQAAARAKLAAEGGGQVAEKLGAATSYDHSPRDGS